MEAENQAVWLGVVVPVGDAKDIASLFAIDRDRFRTTGQTRCLPAARSGGVNAVEDAEKEQGTTRQ